MKFKTLSMKIWITFVSIILSVILCIAAAYFFVCTIYYEKSTHENLMAIHNLIIENNFVKPSELNSFKKLSQSVHLLVKDGKISPVLSEASPRARMPQKRNSAGFSLGHIPNGGRDIPAMHDNEIMDDILSFEKSEKKEQNVTRFYRNKKHIIISTKTDMGCLVSMVSVQYDYELLYFLLCAGIAFIILGFISSKIVSNFITRPLKELEISTGRISERCFDRPVKVDSCDEIGRLADAMNQMQLQLKASAEEEKRFIQGISHELKTPVMVIMGHADALIDGLYIGSPQNTASIIKNESISLSKKINKMLYFNTLDHALEEKENNESVDLSDILCDMITRFGAVRNDIQWKSSLNPLPLTANIDLFSTALENIFENAMRFAKTCISVTVSHSGIIDIYNDGEDIPEDKITGIFEDYYKGSNGRFGLGLAITKKTLRYYGASIKAVNRHPGVSFVIEIKAE